MDDTRWTEISDTQALVALVGEPSARARDKVRRSLTDLDRDWLAASPWCVTPKGDPAGALVHVIDEHTIAIAERPGNRRVDGYRNILANPQVGLLFVIPGRSDTLRVNGRARLVSEAPFLDAMSVKGHRPVLAVVVEVEEVFHHCQKAFLRSQLWEPESWDPHGRVPRRAVLAHALEPSGKTIEELDDHYGPAYREGLYG